MELYKQAALAMLFNVIGVGLIIIGLHNGHTSLAYLGGLIYFVVTFYTMRVNNGQQAIEEEKLKKEKK